MSGDFPQVLKVRLASAQVCVPVEWSDIEATDFMNASHPTGLDHPWAMRKSGHPALLGFADRVRCRDRDGFVHIMFEC